MQKFEIEFIKLIKNRWFSDIYWWNDRFHINRPLKSINRLQKKFDSNSISFWIWETSFPSWIESSIQLQLSRSISNQSTKDEISRFEKFKSLRNFSNFKISFFVKQFRNHLEINWSPSMLCRLGNEVSEISLNQKSIRSIS